MRGTGERSGARIAVKKWAAPEFLEAAAKELIQERWKKVTGDKLPTSSGRIG
jgi:hypothetical protein